MQENLFAALDAPTAKPQEPISKQIKRAYLQESKYQKMKDESSKLQRRWKNLRPAIEAQSRADRERHNALESTAPMTVVLVACVSLKSAAARPSQDLYQSDWFKKARVYAESKGDAWLILSALHGVVEPSEIIEPYDHTLNGKRKAERQNWASRAASRLRCRIPPQSKIIILAGENYRSELIPLLSDRFAIEIPMIGLGIGEQLAYLKKAVEEIT